jgi:hypothetical protein
VCAPVSLLGFDPKGMSSNEIRLSRTTVSVPWEKRSELISRLEESGARDAAEDLRTRRAFAESRKPHVFAVLDAWLQEVGIDGFGEELMDVRHELDRDINGPR